MAAEGSLAGGLARWGDATFALALLIMDERRAAVRLATAILARELPGDPQTLDARIARSLLVASRRRGPRLRQRLPIRPRVLPVRLRRVAPVDRALLGLWLLRRLDGAALVEALDEPAEVLAGRLAAALVRISPDAQTPPDETGLRSALDGWLQPGSNAGAWHAPAEIAARRLVDAARDMLRQTVGTARLPITASEAVVDALEAAGAVEASWLRRLWTLVGGIVGVCALLALIVGPRAGTPAAVLRQPTPHEVVAAALKAWATPPATGTLHRQVWALSSRAADAAPQVTDLWLEADSARHRVEVRRGEQLVEWQVGDGQSQLLHAAMPEASSCRWAEREMLDTAVRQFSADAPTQQRVLDARLALGAYGLGAQLLRAAAQAEDLRSFGTRAEGGSRRVEIGFTEAPGTAPRRLLLWIDAATWQLQLIQELPRTGQGQGRELWRLLTSDAAPIPLGPMRWPRATLRESRLVDPACPGLDPAHVVSLRALDTAPRTWGQLFLPDPVPVTITAAALLRQSPSDGYGAAFGDFPAIFVGPERRLRLQTVWVSSGRRMAGEQVGDWTIALSDEESGVSGEACRPDPVSRACFAVVRFDAAGFTPDELRALLPTLKPLTPQSWLTYDRLFLDPAPLSDEVKAILARAIAAQQPQPDQTVRATLAWRVRTADPGSPPRTPYEPDPRALQPERLTQSLLLEYGDRGARRFRELLTLPDGRLYQGRASDGLTDTSYSLPGKVAQSVPAVSPSLVPPAAPLALALQPFLTTPEPIAVARQDGTVLLTQWGPSGADTSSQPILGPVMAWLGDLVPGRLQRRLWLDAATWQPRRAETVQVDELGDETLLSAVEVIDLGRAAPPATADLALPLPPETIVIERKQTGTFIRGEAANVDAVQHALVWDDIAGITEVFDARPTRLGTDPTVSTDPRLEQAVFSTLPEIAQLGLTKNTIYQLPSGHEIMVQQGPRGLLRHGLRNTFNQRQASSIEPVAPIPLTVAGEPRDGWLVALSSLPVLIVEVDDVLLFVSGLPADGLRETLPPLLAQLTWGDA